MEKYTVNTLADYLGMTRQAVSLAVRDGRCKAKKVSGMWEIDINDWIDYEAGRWDRSKHYRKGEISIGQVAKILNKKVQSVYYLVRKGKIPSVKRGGMLFIRRENI